MVMAGDEEVEAVARVFMALPEPTMAAAEPYTVARAAIAALDRVRSRPAGGTTGGTEDKDHEAGLRAARNAYYRQSIDQPTPPGASLDAFERAVTAYLVRGPSPVSGTEPDTAKESPLDDPIAMARATEALQVSADMPHSKRAHYIVAAALAGFSVDAPSGPDTAKLVEALRDSRLDGPLDRAANAYLRERESAGTAGGAARRIVTAFLSGFSVDAGKAEEER